MAAFLRNPAYKDTTPLDNTFITHYLPQAEGEFVKVYVYGLMQSFDQREAASPFSDEELSRAYAYWQSVGLVRIIADNPLTVEYLPVGAAASRYAAKYAELVKKLAALEGVRALTGHELSQIYEWVETYHFEEDTVVLLVKDCFAKYGSNVKPFQMNAAAKFWADNNVVTPEQAAELIARLESYHKGAQAVLKRLNIRRSANEPEIELYVKWTSDWGFDEETILDACTECTAAANPSFKYLDGILNSYRTEGIGSMQGIAEMRRKQDAAREFARLLLERAGVNKSPTAAQKEDAFGWLNRCMIDPELMLFAADCARGKAQPYGYLKKLINSWYESNISTLAAARADVEERKNKSERSAAAGKMRSAGISSRKYSEEELKNIGIDLLDL